MYSEKVLQHFYDPKNWGKLDNPDGVGEIGNPTCGDILKIYIKVKDDKISNIKFETLGCAAAIAVSSITTEMIKGKTLDDALKINKEDIAKELGGLPPEKMHCSNLAEEALRLAIENYRTKINN